MTAPIRHVTTTDARAAIAKARRHAEALLRERGGDPACYVLDDAHVDTLADVLAERDHHAAHVTELQAAGTKAQEEIRSLRRCIARLTGSAEAAPPLRIKRMGSVATPEPRRAHPGDAGLDLCAALPENLRIAPGCRATIPTGWAVEIPAGYVGLVQPRSGMSKHGWLVATGVIDVGYVGEIAVTLYNHRRGDDFADGVTICPGDRVAQLVLIPCLTCSVEVVDSLSATDRGANGHGSTGVAPLGASDERRP